MTTCNEQLGRSGRNPVIPEIQILLVQYQDGIGNINKSLGEGHIVEDEAHFLKNKLAAIYADAIAHLVEERRRANGHG